MIIWAPWRSYGDHMGVIWGSYGGHIGVIWGSYGDHMGIIDCNNTNNGDNNLKNSGDRNVDKDRKQQHCFFLDEPVDEDPDH